MNKPTTFCLIIALNLLFVFNLSAQLTGSTVNVSAYYPDANTVFTDPGNAVVSGATEYPSGSYSSYNSSWQVDVTDNQIIITDNLSSGLPFGTATFNGFILENISGGAITAATIDPSSTIVPISVSVVGNQVQVNFSGVSVQSGGSAIINLSVGQPIPTLSQWGVIILGLIFFIFAVGVVRQRFFLTTKQFSA